VITGLCLAFALLQVAVSLVWPAFSKTLESRLPSLLEVRTHSGTPVLAIGNAMGPEPEKLFNLFTVGLG
jgi:hypothetical protein